MKTLPIGLNKHPCPSSREPCTTIGGKLYKQTSLHRKCFLKNMAQEKSGFLVLKRNVHSPKRLFRICTVCADVKTQKRKYTIKIYFRTKLNDSDITLLFFKFNNFSLQILGNELDSLMQDKLVKDLEALEKTIKIQTNKVKRSEVFNYEEANKLMREIATDLQGSKYFNIGINH